MNPSECVKSQMFLTSADRPRQERSLVRFARRQKSPHLSLFEMPSMNRRLILNQLPWCCCYVNGVVRATSWLFLTMGKTGQGFLPPQTHPFSQHSPRVSSLHWQRQSHSNTLEPTAASTRLTGSPWRRSLSAESSTHVTLCFYHMMHFHTRVGFFFVISCHLRVYDTSVVAYRYLLSPYSGPDVVIHTTFRKWCPRLRHVVPTFLCLCVGWQQQRKVSVMSREFPPKPKQFLPLSSGVLTPPADSVLQLEITRHSNT